MSEVHLLEALRASTADVLEKMFLVRTFAEREAASGTRSVTAMLTFTGEASGWLRLEVSEAAARAIAGDFLAEEPAMLTAAQIGEVICELANMLCGSALSRQEPGVAFRLTAPQLVAPDAQCTDRTSADVSSVVLRHGALTITMAWKAPQCKMAAELVY